MQTDSPFAHSRSRDGYAIPILIIVVALLGAGGLFAVQKQATSQNRKNSAELSAKLTQAEAALKASQEQATTEQKANLAKSESDLREEVGGLKTNLEKLEVVTSALQDSSVTVSAGTGLLSGGTLTHMHETPKT
jgi:uncharacterized protein HemX